MEQGGASEVSLKSLEQGGGWAKDQTYLATESNWLRARLTKHPDDLVGFHRGQ
jgi:hypothetical protein